MKTFRNAITALFGGALLGIIVAAFAGRHWIPWYYTPAGGSAQCSCQALSTGVAQSMMEWELIGALVGAVVSMLLYFVVANALAHRRNRKADTTAPTGRTATP